MGKRKDSLKNVFVIALGNASLAMGVSLFILPHNIVNGGLSGISIIVNSFFDINPSIVITILTWLLFSVGAIVLKKKFVIKTALSTIFYSIFINIFFNLAVFQNIAKEINDKMLCAIASGLLIGTGLGMVYKVGSSTGGVDVISLILKKYFNIKLSISTFIIDSSIILLGLFSVSLEGSLYGLICVFIESYMIEKIMINGNRSYIAHIVSDKSKEINDYLINNLKRGTTLIPANGGLTGEDKTVIEIAFNEKEYYELKKNIYMIDAKAFISVYKSTNVYGTGFEEYIGGR